MCIVFKITAGLDKQNYQVTAHWNVHCYKSHLLVCKRIKYLRNILWLRRSQFSDVLLEKDLIACADFDIAKCVSYAKFPFANKQLSCRVSYQKHRGK